MYVMLRNAFINLNQTRSDMTSSLLSSFIIWFPVGTKAEYVIHVFESKHV